MCRHQAHCKRRRTCAGRHPAHHKQPKHVATIQAQLALHALRIHDGQKVAVHAAAPAEVIRPTAGADSYAQTATQHLTSSQHSSRCTRTVSMTARKWPYMPQQPLRQAPSIPRLARESAGCTAPLAASLTMVRSMHWRTSPAGSRNVQAPMLASLPKSQATCERSQDCRCERVCVWVGVCVWGCCMHLRTWPAGSRKVQAPMLASLPKRPPANTGCRHRRACVCACVCACVYARIVVLAHAHRQERASTLAGQSVQHFL